MVKINEVIAFGGGCFWCTEAVFNNTLGVIKATPGYAGGTLKNPTYNDVSTGMTGHAEVVKVEFNPKGVTLRQLLQIFFTSHDPTTPNRQGPDVGEQYRSMILFTTPAQKEETANYIKELEEEGAFPRKIVTELLPLEEFYPAESYHEDYYQKHKGSMYCEVVITPKLIKLMQTYPDLTKNTK